MAGTSSSADGSSSKAIKLGLVVALLVTAGVVYYLRTRTAGQDSTTTILFVCPVDGATLSMTPAGYAEALESGEAGPAEGATARRPGTYVRCPKCKKFTMVVGTRCEKDGTVFPARAPDGSMTACPKCGWKPQEPQRE
jgi:hypothetical protein